MKTKKVGRPTNPCGPTRPVRIANDIVQMADSVAKWNGISLSSYLSEKLRDIVRFDFKAMLQSSWKQDEDK